MGTSAEKHARQKQGRNSKIQEATIRAKQSSRRRRVVTAIGVVLGLAILLKGPIGPLVALLAVLTLGIADRFAIAVTKARSAFFVT